jgi:hypothetical protein
LVASASVLESKPQGMPIGQREQDDSRSKCRHGESQQETKAMTAISVVALHNWPDTPLSVTRKSADVNQVSL